jgi:lysophospholipase
VTAPFHAEVADAPPGAEPLWLRAEDGARLRAVLWRGGARGTVLVLPGRTEYIEKYGRVAGRLRALGFAVAILDWRGQGLSERHPVWPQFGQIEDFAVYQRDVAALLDHPDIAVAPRPTLLLCHSMGGTIGLRALMTRPEIAGAVFSAPMWGIAIRPAARVMLGPVTGAALLLGFGPRAMPGSGGRDAPEFAANRLTSDRDAFDWASRQVMAHPELALGAPSVRWTRAAFRETARLARLPSPNRPMLGFLGAEETVVSPRAITARFGAAPDGELVLCPGARHEILMERAEIQRHVWTRIAAFLDRVAPA